MAIQLSPEEKDIRRVVQSVRETVEGRHNAVGTFTLTPGTTTTVVTHPNCSLACCPQIGSPRSANAAAALATTWISSVDQGSFSVTHANNAQADREFGFTVTGG